MARETPRRKQENVDPNQIAGPGVPMGDGFGGCNDPAQAIGIDRLCKQIG